MALQFGGQQTTAVLLGPCKAMLNPRRMGYQLCAPSRSMHGSKNLANLRLLAYGTSVNMLGPVYE